MNKGWLAALALAVALGLGTPVSMADNHKGKGKGHSHQEKRFDRDDQSWEHRGGYEYRVYGDRHGRPPGWSRGRKTGWANCGLPPGQAKKYGCRTYVYQRRTYYYYADEHQRIIVRRPIVRVHAGVDIVQ
jgi:hypothetical protein